MATTLCNYINGAFTPPASGEYIDNVNPATAEVIANIPRSNEEDAKAAVSGAKAAFQEWNKKSALERAAVLDKIANALEARLEEFAQLESKDTGKPINVARTVDIPRCVANFRFFAERVRQTETGCHHMANALNYTVRKGVGVAVLIVPWNLPLYLLSWKVAPALVMGNAVVCKPSELTPLTANALAEVMHEVGVPPGVFNVTHGYGAEIGAPLVAHPDATLVSFTGGTVTGRRVAAATAPLFKKVSLELGGKNATIVFADADFDRAVDGAVRAAFLNSGQICLCGSRVLVERPIYERFVAAMVERTRAFTVGNPASPDTRLGSLISEAHRDKVEGYVTLAREEGGTIAFGGTRPELPAPNANGFFLLPTIITGLAPTARCATEEIFGPVVTVHAFDREEEAVAIANSTQYGLAGSVWTQSLSRAHRVARAIETGMIWVNCWLVRDLRVPFGGVKESGVGREGGDHSLEFYSESMNICVWLG